MLTYLLLEAQTQPEFQEVAEPHAGPGQVVVRVAGSTDLTVITRDRRSWKDEPPPFTLGHEIAGWVEELVTGVTGFRRGDAVAVSPSWGSCGRCYLCRSGEENHCPHQRAIRAPGYDDFEHWCLMGRAVLMPAESAAAHRDASASARVDTVTASA